MLRMNLHLSDCHGQCYDDAAIMCGSKFGVVFPLMSGGEPCATFIHCYSHALNVAVGETVKKNRVL